MLLQANSRNRNQGAFGQCEEPELNDLNARVTALKIKAKSILLEASSPGITPASTYVRRPPRASSKLPASKNSLSPSISSFPSRSSTSESQSSVSTSATSYASKRLDLPGSRLTKDMASTSTP